MRYLKAVLATLCLASFGCAAEIPEIGSEEDFTHEEAAEYAIQIWTRVHGAVNDRCQVAVRTAERHMSDAANVAEFCKSTPGQLAACVYRFVDPIHKTEKLPAAVVFDAKFYNPRVAVHESLHIVQWCEQGIGGHKDEVFEGLLADKDM